ncbi:tail fiber [Stenotrophomonas phage c9-N]|nr:tail fiber [Stenotrophomonas phage c9-N]
MHFRLFNKPAAFDIKTGTPIMWIDGAYDDYVPGEPYEGSVDIHGGVGLMKVKVLGANIPPGASVFIDQLRKRVVVKWMKYSPPTIEVKGVPNGSFEDESFWEFVGASTPARVESGWSPNGKGNLTYRDQKGEYRVRGAWAPVSSNTRQVTISGKVEHGKSSKGNASCGVGLSWYDADKNLIREDIGSIVSNGGKGRWYDTKAAYTPNDKNIKYVRPLVVFDRRKQNHPIHAGQIEWDHVYVDGYDEDDILWVEVEVTDSLGNKARHKGNIEVTGTYMISQLYPWTVDQDAIGAALTYVNQSGKSSFDHEDMGTGLPVVLEVGYKTAINRYNDEERVATTLPVVTSVVYKLSLIRHTPEPDRAIAGLPVVSSATYIKTVKNAGLYSDYASAALPAILEVTYK